MNAASKTIIFNIMQNLETAHEEMTHLPESFRRESAYDLIEKAHQAVALLLLSK
jgi:hypothetical protein